jgi:hypothetical protein
VPTPAFFPRGFAAWSFFSRLRPAARTLPRPLHSPSHSKQPLSPVSMCCAWAARSDPAPRRSAPRVTRARACLLDLRVRGAELLFVLAASDLPRPRRSPSHSGQPLPPVPVCSIRSCAAPTLPRTTRARACLLDLRVRGIFPSCLRLAARNLPLPHRSPSHSRQPLSPVPICCAWAARSDPVPFLTVPRITRARAWPSCFAGRGVELLFAPAACG